jgi:hypothetical protein
MGRHAGLGAPLDVHDAPVQRPVLEPGIALVAAMPATLESGCNIFKMASTCIMDVRILITACCRAASPPPQFGMQKPQI